MKAVGAYFDIIILMRDIDIPANKVLEASFVPKEDKFRGRPISTLLTVINKDLNRTPTGELKFKTKNYLNHLTSIAENRGDY